MTECESGGRPEFSTPASFLPAWCSPAAARPLGVRLGRGGAVGEEGIGRVERLTNSSLPVNGRYRTTGDGETTRPLTVSCAQQTTRTKIKRPAREPHSPQLIALNGDPFAPKGQAPKSARGAETWGLKNFGSPRRTKGV